MEIDGKSIWQVAAGDTDRDYSETFLKWDVILIGPGDHGLWPNQEYINKYRSRPKKFNELKTFCEDAQDGDLVVLRRGTKELLGVGQIVGGYEWHDIFGDIDGWDLQHTRRVRWLWKELKEFPPYYFKWGSTFSLLESPGIRQWLNSLGIPDEAYNRELIQLPSDKEHSRLDLDQISAYLFDCGIASNSIENLMHEMGGLIRVANWYNRSGIKPSEDETRTYLVVPLLRALGWTQQNMAIEWNKIDVALFFGPRREDSTLSVVVEAKKKDKSCLTAQSQAEKYAKDKQTCRRLIVTDGLRYGVFKKSGDKFKLSAYMNLTRLISNYPIYECDGATALLYQISPELTE